MGKIIRRLQPDYLKEMEFVDFFFEIAESKTMQQLYEIMQDELSKQQPAFQESFRHLELSGKFAKGQLKEILRLLFVISLYYNKKLPSPQPFISDELFRRMTYNHTVWCAGFSRLDLGSYLRRWVDSVEVYPSECLYDKLLDRCVMKPRKLLISLTVEDRAFLLSNLKIILDCYEWLVKESATKGNFRK